MKRDLFAYSIVFFAALSIRIWFVFADNHLAVAAIADSSEYLKDAKDLYAVLTCNAPFSSIALMIKQAGCVFPAFLTLTYLLTGRIPDGFSIIGPLLGQCVISALSCVFIALTAQRCFDKSTAITSAVLAIIYPGFIANTTRILSENLAVLLISALCYLSVSLIQETEQKKRLGWSLALGATLTLLQQTRSAMVLVLVPVMFALLVHSKSKGFLKLLLNAVFGFIIILAPIFCLQKLSVNSFSFMPDRKQNYNLCIGSDPVGKGWITYPFMNFATLENKSTTQIIKEQMRQNKGEFWSLMMDKPARLFKFHWNDFRIPIGPIAMSDQIFLHQLILFLGCVGLGFGLFAKSGQEQEGQNKFLSRVFLLSLIGIHAVYLLFSTLPRYGITAMSEILIFAAAGLVTITKLVKNKTTRKEGLLIASTGLALLILLRLNLISVLRAVPGVTHFNTAFYLELGIKATFYLLFTALLFHISSTCHNFSKKSCFVITALSILIMPFTVTHLACHGRSNEWKTEVISNGNSIKQNILVNKNEISDLLSRDCFIIIDCQNWHALGQNTEVFANNQKLDGPVFPLMPLTQNLGTTQEMENLFSSLLLGAGGELHDLRQWYAISLPATFLANIANQEKPHLDIEIKCAKNRSRKSEFFGSYVPKRNQVIIPGFHQYSWDKTFCGVERTDQFSDPRFEEKFLLSELSEGKEDLSGHTGFQSGTYNIRLLAASKTQPAVQLFKTVQNSLKQSSKNIDLKIKLLATAQYDRQSIWVITFKGNLRNTQNNSFTVPIRCTASLNSSTRESRQYFYPSSIEIDPGDNRVQFSFLANPSILQEPLKYVDLSISEGGRSKSSQYFGVKNYHESYLPSLSWTESSLTISEMRTNPINDGFEIF